MKEECKHVKHVHSFKLPDHFSPKEESSFIFGDLHSKSKPKQCICPNGNYLVVYLHNQLVVYPIGTNYTQPISLKIEEKIVDMCFRPAEKINGKWKTKLLYVLTERSLLVHEILSSQVIQSHSQDFLPSRITPHCVSANLSDRRLVYVLDCVTNTIHAFKCLITRNEEKAELSPLGRMTISNVRLSVPSEKQQVKMRVNEESLFVQILEKNNTLLVPLFSQSCLSSVLSLY